MRVSGHIRVNGVKCNIASRRCFVGDEISLGSKATEMALHDHVQTLLEQADQVLRGIALHAGGFLVAGLELPTATSASTA
jgi:ribosomal protein S4